MLLYLGRCLPPSGCNLGLVSHPSNSLLALNAVTPPLSLPLPLPLPLPLLVLVLLVLLVLPKTPLSFLQSLSGDIRHTLQQYIHRVGRTARAGREGSSITLVGENERKLLKEIVKTGEGDMKSRVIPPKTIEK